MAKWTVDIDRLQAPRMGATVIGNDGLRVPLRFEVHENLVIFVYNLSSSVSPTIFGYLRALHQCGGSDHKGAPSLEHFLYPEFVSVIFRPRLCSLI